VWQCILTPIIAVLVQRVGKVETVNAEVPSYNIISHFYKHVFRDTVIHAMH
jgi:hypothetical protein